MNTFNLFTPDRSTIQFQTMLFPDSQPHVKLDMSSVNVLNKEEPLQILARIANANDLLTVLFAKNTLDYLEFALCL